MDGKSSVGDDACRKRPSSRIRACWECKKRKTLADSAIDGFNNSSTTLHSDGSNREGEEGVCARHLGERLCKLEQFFEKFVCRKFPNSTASAEKQRNPTPSSVASDETPFKFTGLPDIPSAAKNISTIGDGILAAQHASWTSAPSFRPLVNDSGPRMDVDPTRRALVALLPSQNDANIIFESSNGWMILGGIYRPAKDLFVGKDHDTYALDMSAIAQEQTIVIARTLLHIAVCISTLPSDFESSRLSNMWNVETARENYVRTVTSLVTSSDEQLLTLPGLETLLLYAVYLINTANLRKAWLIIRRTIDLAHMMGFHRIIEQPQQMPPVEAIDNAAWIWRRLVDFDTVLGLHLRLPFAIEECPPVEDGPPHVVQRSRLTKLSRQIGELDREVTPQTYAQALALDEKVESLMREQPKEFWEVPNVPPTARTAESSAVLDRLMVQVGYFELKIFIHLPYLLRAATETRYEYSKVTALQASRNVVMRWFALRNSGITQACCRFGEIGVFIAAVTLSLDILIEMSTKEKPEVKKAKASDFTILCRLISEMEKLGNSNPREKMAARSAVVLKKILGSLDPSCREKGKIRLTIPYFGTIEMDYKKLPVRPAFDLDSDTAKKVNSTESGQHYPVFSFVSNTLWPSFDGEDRDLDFDIILFDGLQDMDVDGNWVF